MKKETTKSSKKGHNKVTFKPYVQNQMWLLPPSLGELIPANHIVRLVNDAIDGMDLEPLLNAYEGGGASNYHPKMMLKALVYGYIEKIYSSRGIEKALTENICFMWLCGMQQPDHNTLNRFRNSQLKQTVKEVFSLLLAMLIEQGHVRLNDYYVDGTKMESVANRYTFVWAKNVERYKSGLLDKIATLIEQIEAANNSAEELAAKQSAEKNNPVVSDSEALKTTIAELNTKLAAELDQNSRLKKKIDKLEKEHLPKLKEYEKQEELLQGRSSYSKTDPDATFMRTKEDHLGTGQLKPSYNIQFGTEDQFIVNYTVHQSASDMAVLIDHMEDTQQVLEQINQPLPKRIGADAGYGSEQNYEFLEQKSMKAFVKYPGYYKDKKKSRKHVFHQENLFYNEEFDFFICPMGQRMNLKGTREEKNKTGYLQQVSLYQAQRCDTCPLRGVCHKAKGNRIIRVNHRAKKYRQQAKQRLDSLRGIRMRKQRNVDTEPVFGHIKQDRQFRRFMLKGIEGVSTETGLLAIAHNIKKWWRKTKYIHMNRPALAAKMPKINRNNLFQLNLALLRA